MGDVSYQTHSSHLGGLYHWDAWANGAMPECGETQCPCGGETRGGEKVEKGALLLKLALAAVWSCDVFSWCDFPGRAGVTPCSNTVQLYTSPTCPVVSESPTSEASWLLEHALCFVVLKLGQNSVC